jgi:hypothetical protein
MEKIKKNTYYFLWLYMLSQRWISWGTYKLSEFRDATKEYEYSFVFTDLLEAEFIACNDFEEFLELKNIVLSSLSKSPYSSLFIRRAGGDFSLEYEEDVCSLSNDKITLFFPRELVTKILISGDFCLKND